MMITEFNSQSCYVKLYTSGEGLKEFSFLWKWNFYLILFKMPSTLLLKPIIEYRIFLNGTVGNITLEEKSLYFGMKNL